VSKISDDLDAGTENDVDTTDAAPPASTKSLKAFAAKKGPKLARGRGKPSVTLNTKVGAKKAPQKPGGPK
jgi:hypothetical protein